MNRTDIDSGSFEDGNGMLPSSEPLREGIDSITRLQLQRERVPVIDDNLEIVALSASDRVGSAGGVIVKDQVQGGTRKPGADRAPRPGKSGPERIAPIEPSGIPDQIIIRRNKNPFQPVPGRIPLRIKAGGVAEEIG
ncbi:MAG: hypothetical protein U9N73_13290 [Candidatus Auribacterota bacterium]|nr:hypothetical protein [Candidatus Auribacterota bacterium]